MRIEVIDDGIEMRIEGWCHVPGFGSTEAQVIGFNKRGDHWHTGTSMALPSDIKAAKIILYCQNAALAKLEELTAE